MRDESRRAGEPSSPTNQESSVKRWFLLDGNRYVLVALLAALELAILLALGWTGLVPMTSESANNSLFATASTGLFTLVTITVSINQLVLSRILGTPEQIRARMNSVESFRGRLEKMDPGQEIPPIEPPKFLRFVTTVLQDRTRALDSAFEAESHGPRTEERVRELVDSLTLLSERVVGKIEREVDKNRAKDMYVSLAPVLNNSYSQHIHSARFLRTTLGGELSESEDRALAELVHALEQVNLTRHYFKTLYTHEELATLTQAMLLTGVPALFVTSLGVLAFGQGLSLAPAANVLLVSVTFTASTIPLLILFSFVLRVTAVAMRTTTYGTFLPAEELPGGG